MSDGYTFLAIIAAVFGFIILKNFIAGFARPSRKAGANRIGLPDQAFLLEDVYVIDGDTIAKHDLRIRLFGMDAPEMSQPQGAESRRALEQIVIGERLRIEPLERDVYGRIVGHVKLEDGTDVGALMVRAGYAIAIDQRMRRLEKIARRSKAGLWLDGGFEDPRDWRGAQKA